jgi:hypothetical protein
MRATDARDELGRVVSMNSGPDAEWNETRW